MNSERITQKTDGRSFLATRFVELVRTTALRVALITTVFGITATAVAGDAPDLPANHHKPSPASRLRAWFQTGTASWYGGKFQGRKTANGETYNMNALTCAHRDLPLGTWLRVTNLRNRRSVVVRVNDRGPFVDNRIVDLSYAAARIVGIGGVSKVKLEQVAINDPAVARTLVAQMNPFEFPQLVPAR